MSVDETTGIIFNVQHFSLQDGPGIRSTVFFKGCPLRCRWCSNPESQSVAPQFLHYPALCRRCGTCVERCPEHALSFGEGGTFVRSDACMGCGTCTTVCGYGANSLSGRQVTVRDVCLELREDWRFYMESGGGITCSGGEPLAQPEFLRSILKVMHDDLGYDTCIETCCYATWKTVASMLPHLSRMFVDMKHMDSSRHREATGVDNGLILENVERLGSCGIPVVVRIPLIPGFNDTVENITALGRFMENAGLLEIEIMPQHTFGKSKYEALGRRYDVDETTPPATKRAVGLLREYVADVYVRNAE